jgi:hypothetical protein
MNGSKHNPDGLSAGPVGGADLEVGVSGRRIADFRMRMGTVYPRLKRGYKERVLLEAYDTWP